MSATIEAERPLVAELPGVAADHLYREGSAHASFWEAVFGSSLSAKRRTQISVREDGARQFVVPTGVIEQSVMQAAVRWFAHPDRIAESEPMLRALDENSLRIRLVGVQPRGSSVAHFALRFESTRTAFDPRLAPLLSRWFAASDRGLAQDILIPFGFTPEPVSRSAS